MIMTQVVAFLRAAAVHHKLNEGKGDFSVELLGVEVAGADVETSKQVLESLGFKPGASASRYMVRGRDSDIYPEASGLIAASSFEYA